MPLSEEQLTEKYMEFQIFQKQVEQLNEHLETMNQQDTELDISINAIKELAQTKIDTEILAPIANGIFVKSKLIDNQTFIVNVGADTTVERVPLEVIALLQQQKEELASNMVEAQQVLQQMTTHLRNIYQEVEEHRQARSAE